MLEMVDSLEEQQNLSCQANLYLILKQVNFKDYSVKNRHKWTVVYRPLDQQSRNKPN